MLGVRSFVAQAEATGTTEYMAPECFDASFQSDAKLRPRTMTWQLAGADGLAVLRYTLHCPRATVLQQTPSLSEPQLRLHSVDF